MIERIRAVRKQLDINQGEFARRIGLTQAAMSMIEVGKSRLTEKNIRLICTTFNINETWFRTGEGPMFASSAPLEKELIGIFRRLTPDTQEFLMEMAQNLLERQEKLP
jgi:transcriptional regulator with XRE-family HTH domain